MSTGNHVSLACKDMEGINEFKNDDLVIFITGPTGTGKSHLIDTLACGQLKRANGHLAPNSSDVRAIRIKNHPQYKDRVVLVDTPGFDDRNRSDLDVLRSITDWLAEIYRRAIYVRAIIYTHRITDLRMNGAHLKILKMFIELCGEKMAQKMIFVTTMWDTVNASSEEEEREKNLRNTYWQKMLCSGASVLRFDNTLSSAAKILHAALSKSSKPIALQIQEEIFRSRKHFSETKAAKLLAVLPAAYLNDRTLDGKEILEQEQTGTAAGSQKEPEENAQHQKGRRSAPKMKTIKSIVILVMGATGAGKSTFINTILGEYRVEVGYGLTSCTSEIERVELPSFALYPQGRGCRLILIDTPGFDATYEDDFRILERIAACVKDIYNKKEILGGIIYLHDITNDRLSTAARDHLRMLKKLCGDAALKNVVLGTTKWSRDTEGKGPEREKELREQYWGPLINMGSTVEKFDGTRESASRIVEDMLNRTGFPGITLDIQRELVDEQKTIEQTEAGRIFQKEKQSKPKEKEGLFRRIRRFFGFSVCKYFSINAFDRHL